MEYDIIVSMVVIHYSQSRTLDGVVTKHIYNCRHSSTPSRRGLATESPNLAPKSNPRLQGGEDTWDVLSLQVIFCTRAL